MNVLWGGLFSSVYTSILHPAGESPATPASSMKSGSGLMEHVSNSSGLALISLTHICPTGASVMFIFAKLVEGAPPGK
jgi:hypothetical protein